MTVHTAKQLDKMITEARDVFIKVPYDRGGLSKRWLQVKITKAEARNVRLETDSNISASLAGDTLFLN
jgi:hypothetical protein